MGLRPKSDESDLAGGIGARSGRAVQRPHESNVIAVRELRAFRFDGGRFDLRGCPVFSSDGVEVGTVESIFVDHRYRQVRYLGVALDERIFDSKQRRVLVPVGAARRSPDRSAALTLGSITAAQLRDAPAAPNRPVTRADEDATLASYGMATSRDVPNGALYEGPDFREESLFGTHASG